MHRPVDRTAVAKQKHIRHSIGRNGIAIPRNQAFGFVAIVPSAFRTLIREISAAKIHTPNLVAPLAETGSESTKKGEAVPCRARKKRDIRFLSD